MSDVLSSDDGTEIDAAARFDETVAGGDDSGLPPDGLDPELVALIRELHAQLRCACPDVTAATGLPGPAPPQRHYGRFQLHRRLGAGSFGVVYLARDPVLQREVSLKIPRLHTLESDDAQRRFVREAQAVGRLKHPYIVQVFQADMHANAAYIAAEYCSGPNLERWLRGRTCPVPPRTAAAIAANLADALGCAHEAGILHRDVKPGNVLLSEPAATDEEVPSRIRLADFGLARFVEQEAGTATTDGALIGTLAYMAPEQIRRSFGEVGRATDIHAVGALLYELLTLRQPYSGEPATAATLQRICDEIPRAPDQLVTGIPRDLATICLKCLEKYPARRYQDGQELAADLRRFLNGEPTLARPLSPPERMLRTMARHPWGTGVVASIVLASALVVVAVLYHNHRLGELLQTANDNLDLANERQVIVTDMLYAADMRLALNALRDGDPGTVRRRLERYRQQPGVRGIEWSLLDRQIPEPDHMIAAHEGAIYSSVVSPDGSLLATAGQDQIIRLWDIAARRSVGELRGHTGEVNDIAFNSDGTLLVSGSDDRTARVWNVATRSTVLVLADPDAVVFGVAISPDGEWLATGGRGQLVRLWSASGDLVETLDSTGADIEQLVFSPQGEWLAAASGDGVHLWSMADRSQHRMLPVEEPYVGKLSFSPDGRLIAAACQNRHLYLWETETGDGLADWSGHRDVINDVEFTPDGSFVATCGRDGTLRFWPVPDGSARVTEPIVVEAGDVFLWSLAFCDQGRTVVSSGKDGTLQFWSMERIHATPEFGTVGQQVRWMALSPDGARLAAVRMDDTIAVWDIRREAIQAVLGPVTDPISTAIQFSGDGNTIATGHGNGDILLWPADGSAPPRLLGRQTRSINDLCFSPSDDEVLFSCSVDGSVRSWNTRTGAGAEHAQFIPGNPLTLAVSPQGDRLACDTGLELVVWTLPAWKEEFRFPEQHGRPNSLQFSANGNRLVSAHNDHVVQVRDLQDGDAPSELTGHTAKVMDAVFSGDGRTIISVSHDESIRLWHVPTLQEIGVLRHGDFKLHSLCAPRDGRGFAASYEGDGDQSGLLLWRID